MTDILDKIVSHKRAEVEQMKTIIPPTILYREVEQMIDSQPCRTPSMRQALTDSQTGIIAEFKRRSPSKGWIKEDGRADIIPLSYQHNGAAAISILTDNEFFGGEDSYITTARQSGVTLPVLYKNFITDEYQLFQARRCGASAVLLIASVLTMTECRQLIDQAHRLGMEVLLETHHQREADYAQLCPDMIGVNNRNLGSFVTDVDNSFRMAQLLPQDMCKVSESGIADTQTILRLREVGYRGFLIGETFMKTDSPGETLNRFVEGLTHGQ